nr:cytokine receptor common subunit beta [Peromyscus maniculatus bairdii]
MTAASGGFVAVIIAPGNSRQLLETGETVPLQTLQCYNDYTSRIICSWADMEDAQGLMNVTLYRKLEKNYPVSCDLSEDLLWSECPSLHRCVPRRCFIPYTQFMITDEDYYSFQPNRDVGIQLVLPLAQHVQPPPPKDLHISPSGDHFLLKWSVTLGDAPVPWLAQEDIQFEVTYKRLQDSWEGKFYWRKDTMTFPEIILPPVQMHPPTLNVTKDEDSYNLRWETKKMSYPHIEHKFQIQYTDNPDNWEDSKTEILDRAHSMALPQLQPSTTYWARVRVKPLPYYYGIWSQWSEVQTWTTDWVMPTWGTVLSLIFLILFLLLALRFGCVYGCRMYRKWKEKIPNPSKSLLFQWRRVGDPGGWTSRRMSYAHLGVNEVSPLTIENPNIVQDPPSGPDSTPSTSSEPMDQLSNDQRDPPTPSGRPGNRTPSFDFDGPYLGSLQTHSQPDLPGPLVTPQIGGSLRPALPGSLEYLCLPPGGQVQLVPMSQAMGQGQAVTVECEPSLGSTESSSMELMDSPSLEPRLEEQEPKDNPVTLPISSGGPEDPVVASGYVSPADLVLTLPTGLLSTSLTPFLGSPSAQGPSLCLKLPGVPPLSPALPPPEFDDYVDLPPSMSQAPQSPLDSSVPPVPSISTASPAEPREEVAPASPHPEGLLVLQQVGDYCFLPGLGPGSPSPSPHNKPPSPGLCPETVDLDQDLSVKKLPCQPMPQVPAIQFFKSLKHQDYLSLPPWDSSQPGKVC